MKLTLFLKKFLLNLVNNITYVPFKNFFIELFEQVTDGSKWFSKGVGVALQII